MVTQSRSGARRLAAIAVCCSCPWVAWAAPSSDDIPPGIYTVAQSDSPGMAPAVARKLSAATPEGDVQLSMSDRVFIEEALRNGLAEVNDSRLAQVRSESDAIREKAEEIENGYAESNRSLKRIAALHGMDVPIEPSADRRERYAKLQDLQGAAFDAQYIASALELQERHIALFERAADATDNAEVKQFVRETLPVLKANREKLATQSG